jgi:putative hydrolase
MSDPYDIPLFRELQKLLQSGGGGPINMELARQVGTAVTGQAGYEPKAPPDQVRTFDEAVRESEQLITGYSRLAADEPLRTSLLTRAEFVAQTLDGWRWLLERLAERFSGELTKLSGPAEETPGATGPLGPMSQMTPLLMGMQAGSLIGQLSLEFLARFDVPIPREDDGRLFFLPTNIDAVAIDYGFEGTPFRRWLSLHSAARQILVRAVPWLDNYTRSLFSGVVDTIELDVADLERRVMEMQSGDMGALEGGARNLIPLVQNDQHVAALGRLKAALAIFEGYADHVCSAIAPNVVDDAAKISEGMSRHRASPSEGKAALTGLLGISMDRALQNSAETFCAAVAKLHGIAALNRLWEAADSLPNLAEIKDPFLWMERVIAEQ